MKPFAYENYTGEGKYLYLCTTGEEDAPIYLAEKLAEEPVNLVLDIVGKEAPAEMAEKIAGASACLFFFSTGAVTSVAFRNRVNHAVACGKTVVCLRESFVDLAHGMEMQLANYPAFVYAGPEWTIHQLKEKKILTPEVAGEMPKKVWKGTGKYLVIAAVMAAIAVLVLNVYWDRQDRKTIVYYEGQTMESLDLSDAGLITLSGIEKISVKDLNISGNPAITDFSPLLLPGGPETVRISQDMLKYGHLLKDNVRLVITK